MRAADHARAPIVGGRLAHSVEGSVPPRPYLTAVHVRAAMTAGCLDLFSGGFRTPTVLSHPRERLEGGRLEKIMHAITIQMFPQPESQG